MANQTAICLISNITFSSYSSHLGYAIQGFVMCLGNALLLAVIGCEESLRKRKEMLLIAGLVFADLLYGLAALILGVYRILILSLGLSCQAATSWDCVILLPVFLTHIAAQLNAVMSFVLSVDRYIAVAYPIYFRALTRNYARSVLLCVGAYGIVALAIMLMSTYLNRDQPNSGLKMNLMCSGTPFPGWYAKYQYTLILLVGIMAVLFYIGVFVRYRASMSKVSPALADRQVIQQRSLTVTLGFITLSTLILFIVPYSIFAVTAWIGVPPPEAALLGTLSRFSTIVNILIVVIKQKEIQEAFKKIFRLYSIVRNES